MSLDSDSLSTDSLGTGNPSLWEPSKVFVNVAIAALLVGCGLTALALRIFVPLETYRLLGPSSVAVVTFIGWFLLHSGNLRAAVNFLYVGVWASLLAIGVFTGGVYAPTAIVFPVIVLLTGWLVSARAALVIGVLTMVAIAAFVNAQISGVLPKPVAFLPALHGTVQAIMIGVSVTLAYFLVTAYRNRIKEIQRANQGFREQAEALEMHRVDLNRAQAVGKVGSWIYDEFSKSMAMSAECSRIFGVPQGHRGTRDRFIKRLPREDQLRFGLAWKKALETGVLDIEHRVFILDQTRWIHQRAELEFAADASLCRVLGVAQDITEIKVAQLSQRASESKFRTIIEATPVPLLLHDANGSINYVNKAFLNSIGYPLLEIPNLDSWWEKACPNDDYRRLVVSGWSKIAQSTGSDGKTLGELEVKIRCVDGTDRSYMTSLSPLSDGSNETTLVVLYDITERIVAEESIRNLVFYDQLTNLPNRRLLLDRMAQALAFSTRNRKYNALLFIDLDNFKTINDTHGHSLGDLLLKQVAVRLSSCIRVGDTVARLGGDEFVVMLEDLSVHEFEASQHAQGVGEKIISALNTVYQLSGHQHHNTASIGITMFVDHGGSPDDLLTRADLAMYQAKAAGRNALCFFDPRMQATVNARAALEAGIREALLNFQFTLYYQPQVDMNERFIGAECLIRWDHPDGKVVSPADFIPLAEETRLIVPIGQWVLQTACERLAQWAKRPQLAELTLSVNVSVHQFNDDDFVEQVKHALSSSGANPSLLKLELTESLLVADVDAVVAKMLALKQHGVALSLDDFGTGYSSLSYLKRLPLDQLKIDRSFVQDLPGNGDDIAIVKAIISLAENMNISLMAEGIETPDQHAFLGDLGCVSFQGYLFGKPVTVNTFEENADRMTV